MDEGLTDTPVEVDRVHLELLRAASPSRRLRLALSLSGTVLSMARARVNASMPGAPAADVAARYVAELYGEALADGVHAALTKRLP